MVFYKLRMLDFHKPGKSECARVTTRVTTSPTSKWESFADNIVRNTLTDNVTARFKELQRDVQDIEMPVISSAV